MSLSASSSDGASVALGFLNMENTENTLRLLNDLLSYGDFEAVDRILVHENTVTQSPATLLAILSITYYAKDKLRNRDQFVIKVEQVLAKELGVNRANELLKNRR